jgi:hypothetical protein
MEQINYRGVQELVRSQAPQLEAVRPALSDLLLIADVIQIHFAVSAGYGVIVWNARKS